MPGAIFSSGGLCFSVTRQLRIIPPLSRTLKKFAKHKVGSHQTFSIECWIKKEAICSALEQLIVNVSKILLCFFHVIKNCKEH